MKVDHFGSGGRRSDSRLGLWGEKLGDCGIVGLWDCGEIAISEISGFFMVLLMARAKRERVVQDGVEKANRRPDRPTRHPSLLL